MNEHPTASETYYLDTTHLQNLEQLPDEEFWDYARQRAQQVPAAQPEEYLECALSKGCCLIPLAALKEVVLPPHRLAMLPATPEWMPGVVAWRGEVIAVIDLSMHLSGHTLDLSNGILLIAQHAGIPLGLLVPAIGQTTSIQQDMHVSPAAEDPKATVDLASSWYIPTRARYVKGVQREAIILDVPLLLADAVQHIETAASNG
jgi:chemotaxis signal transduction protein